MEGEPRKHRYSPGEHALTWIGLLLPGLLSPWTLILWFGMSYGGSTNDILLLGIPLLWLVLLLGCCWMCGWIQATKRGPENVKTRAAKAAALFLLGQVLLTPLLGFGACALMITLNG